MAPAAAEAAHQSTMRVPRMLASVLAGGVPPGPPSLAPANTRRPSPVFTTRMLHTGFPSRAAKPSIEISSPCFSVSGRQPCRKS